MLQVGDGVLESVGASRLVSMYLSMLRIRRAEEVIAELVAAGEILCPCHLYIGQEAVAVGICSSLNDSDWVYSTHRSHGHFLAKGGGLKSMFAELYCREDGCSRGRGGSMHLACPEKGLPGSSAIVAGTIPLAAGSALAFSMRGEPSVAVAFFGDGAANEGVFYETLNFASLKKLPVIFVCENNLYSTHLHVSQCLAGTDIYKKASVFNMPGVRVDGNNILEVYDAGRAMVASARNSGGPALIECMTYRWKGHVGPNDDIDKGLRSRRELLHWKRRCPVAAFRKLLIGNGVIDDAGAGKLERGIDTEIQEAVAAARGARQPAGRDLLKNTYKK